MKNKTTNKLFYAGVAVAATGVGAAAAYLLTKLNKKKENEIREDECLRILDGIDKMKEELGVKDIVRCHKDCDRCCDCVMETGDYARCENCDEKDGCECRDAEFEDDDEDNEEESEISDGDKRISNKEITINLPKRYDAPYFADSVAERTIENVERVVCEHVANTKPKSVSIGDESYDVNTWAELYNKIFTVMAEKHPDIVKAIVENKNGDDVLAKCFTDTPNDNPIAIEGVYIAHYSNGADYKLKRIVKMAARCGEKISIKLEGEANES